jgi:hypothetical protein
MFRFLAFLALLAVAAAWSTPGTCANACGNFLCLHSSPSFAAVILKFHSPTLHAASSRPARMTMLFGLGKKKSGEFKVNQGSAVSECPDEHAL